MSQTNKVELLGGLVREPELRALPSGVFVCEFTMAVNGTRYDRESRSQVVVTAYVACNVWDEAAERFAEADLHQGDEIYVMGRLDQREIEKDGKKESKTRVTVFYWNVVRQRSARSSTAAPREPAAETTADDYKW